MTSLQGSSEHIYEVPYEDVDQWSNGNPMGSGGGGAPVGGINVLPLPPKSLRDDKMMATRNEVNSGTSEQRTLWDQSQCSL